MFALLKFLLKGLLTIVLSPFIVLFLAFSLLFLIIQYIIYEIITLVKFFRGKKIIDDDEETKAFNAIRELKPEILTTTPTSIFKEEENIDIDAEFEEKVEENKEESEDDIDE